MKHTTIQVATPRKRLIFLGTPILVLLLGAGASRWADMTLAPKTTVVSKTGLNNRLNASEESFAGYANAARQFSAGNETGGLALLRSLRDAPLPLDGDQFKSRSLSAYSPQGLLLGLGHRLCAGAKKAAMRGDDATAREYAEALATIGDRVLTDSAPSLKALETAYHFHCFAAQADAVTSGEAGKMARYQADALKSLWRTRFAPRLQEHVYGNGDAEFAAALAREYRVAWGHIRAGEA